MLKITVYLLFALLTLNVTAQTASEKIDSLYKEITIGKVIEQTHILNEIKDLIENQPLTDEERLKSILILANFHEITGNREASIQAAQQGVDFAVTKKMYLWQARLLGFISSAYRSSNMLDFAEKTLLHAIDVSKKSPKDEAFYRFNVNAHYELAYHASNQEDYDKFFNLVATSSFYISKIGDEGLRNFYTASNEQLIGLVYNNKKQPDEALVHLNNALQLIEHNESYKPNILRKFIYNYMGRAYLLKNDTKKAKYYFDIVLNDSLYQYPLHLNKELYENLCTYYQTIGNLDQLRIYQIKTDSISRIINKNNIETINNVTKKINREKLYAEKESSGTHYYVYIVGSLLFTVGIYIFYIIKKRGRKVSADPQVYHKGSVTSSVIDVTKPTTARTDKRFIEDMVQQEEAVKSSKCDELSIAKETEDRLIEEIKKFEAEKEYLNSEVSQTMLANNMHTNTKYITYVLRKLYDKDFSSYINELRINHIVELLEKEQKYRQYKISYLAEVAGYSSHSKFAAIFRKIKGCSPSEFITHLDSEK